MSVSPQLGRGDSKRAAVLWFKQSQLTSTVQWRRIRCISKGVVVVARRMDVVGLARWAGGMCIACPMRVTRRGEANPRKRLRARSRDCREERSPSLAFRTLHHVAATGCGRREKDRSAAEDRALDRAVGTEKAALRMTSRRPARHGRLARQPLGHHGGRRLAVGGCVHDLSRAPLPALTDSSSRPALPLALEQQLGQGSHARREQPPSRCARHLPPRRRPPTSIDSPSRL